MFLSVQERHRDRMGKFEADCALQLELREEEQESQLQALAQQHEAKMAKQEAVSFHCLENNSKQCCFTARKRSFF